MTTECRRPGRETRLHTSPLELRLYMVAFLAAIYAISWRAIGGHSATARPAPVAAPSLARDVAHVVWIDRLPVHMRPPIALPAGWQLASEAPPPTALPTRILPSTRRHAPRVRTRSS